MKYGDNPISSAPDDLLDRGPSVQALATLLRDDALDTPIVVGIQGDWGSGKTSVMRLLRNELESAGLCIWFDAWRYGADRGALWRGLVGTLAEEIGRRLPGHEQQLDKLKDRLYRNLSYFEMGRLQVNWSEAVPWLARTAARIAGAGALIDAVKELNITGAATAATKEFKAEDAEEVAKFIERERTEHYKAQIQSVEQFREALREIIAEYALKESPWKRLFLFADDLDRCLPEVALELIEAIKLFFDFEQCVYVFAMDRRVIAEAVRVRYHELEGEKGLPFEPSEYVDKIVQIPFSLPPLSTAQMEHYIEHWCENHGRPDIRKTCAGLISKATLPNPRGVKRTLNLLNLNSRLWEAGKAMLSESDLQSLAVITILQVRFPQVYAEILKAPAKLRALEGVSKSNQPSDLETFNQNPGLRELFMQGERFGSLNDDQITNLLFPGRRLIAQAPSR